MLPVSLYVIGDLHLSFGTDKPMDIFSGWTNYLERLEENWQNKVKPEDTVVIAGDVSWGMTMEEALEDFRFIDRLNGTKIILKGNHDYWFSTKSKVENALCRYHKYQPFEIDKHFYYLQKQFLFHNYQQELVPLDYLINLYNHNRCLLYTSRCV